MTLSHELLMQACRDRSDTVALALAGALANAAAGVIQAPSPPEFDS